MKTRKAIQLAERLSDNVPEADRQTLVKAARSTGVTNREYIMACLLLKLASSNPHLCVDEMIGGEGDETSTDHDS